MVREVLTVERLRALAPDDAAALYVVRRAEGMSDGEAAAFGEWLASDAANGRALASAERAWDAFDGEGADELLAALRVHARTARPASWAAVSWRQAAAVAAVLLVTVGGALAYFGTQPPRGAGPGQPSVLALQSTSYVTAVGEVRDVALPDGTQMTLDADSAAIARYGDGMRAVQLTRGRAFFAVVHDAAHPFFVTAGDRRLVDLGTRFEVNLGPAALTVTLVDGHLGVSSVAGAPYAATLEPGQQLVRSAGRDEVRTIAEADEDVAAWRTGLIRFDDETLVEATAVMNRYSAEKLVIHDPKVAAIRVSGQFRAGQTDAFAETLTELYGLRAQHQAGEIDLQPGR